MINSFLRSSLLITLFFIAIYPINSTFAQLYYRVKADFSIKEKTFEDTYRLLIGQVYYDLHHKKIVYDIQFPEKEIWVQTDSITYIYKNNEFDRSIKAYIFPEISIYSLAFQGNLKDMNFNDHPFMELKEVKKEGDLLIKTIVPNKKYKKKIG
jgi:hypothetical protein